MCAFCAKFSVFGKSWRIFNCCRQLICMETQIDRNTQSQGAQATIKWVRPVSGRPNASTTLPIERHTGCYLPPVQCSLATWPTVRCVVCFVFAFSTLPYAKSCWSSPATLTPSHHLRRHCCSLVVGCNNFLLNGPQITRHTELLRDRQRSTFHYFNCKLSLGRLLVHVRCIIKSTSYWSNIGAANWALLT